MKRSLALLFLLLLASCTTTHVHHQRHETRLSLFVPELIGPHEPRADDVSVLLRGGRVLRFRGVELRRDGDTLTVDGGPGRAVLGTWPIDDVRAILLVEQTSRAMD